MNRTVHGGQPLSHLSTTKQSKHMLGKRGAVPTTTKIIEKSWDSHLFVIKFSFGGSPKFTSFIWDDSLCSSSGQPHFKS